MNAPRPADETLPAWKDRMQELYRQGRLDALEALMGMPDVEEFLMREVQRYGLNGDEQRIRDRAIRSLRRSHRDYDPGRQFEPWARAHIREAVSVQGRWRRRPRKIWKALSSDVVWTEFERRAVELRADLRPALDELSKKEFRIIEVYLSGITSPSEIADRLGLEVQATFRIYYKALRKLRNFFEARGDGAT